MFKYVLLLLCLTILLIKNLLTLFILILTIFLIEIFFIKEFKIKSFLEKLDKLSIFCISLFISYALISIFKQNENIFFIYIKDATIIILKIIDIIFINFFISTLKLEKYLKNTTISRIIKYFPLMEEILFNELSRYPGKIKKLKNIDKIVVDFIYKSMLCIQNLNKKAN